MTMPEIKRLNAKPSKITYAVKATPYGDMMVGVCPEGICWMGYDFDGSVMKSRFPDAEFLSSDFLAHNNTLALYGTDFQVSVWQELLKISEGATKTYSEIANDIGKPKAHRAVGTAVGANPISGAIPCHRVLPAAGGVGNYLWGAEKKAALLNQENLSL